MSTILVVHRDASLLEALRRLLVVRGYVVTTAQGSAATLEQLRTAPPDLLILDLGLPGRKGLETVRLVRQWHPELPIVLTVDSQTLSTALEATRLGGVDYEAEPLEGESLLAAVRKALDRVQRRQDEAHAPPVLLRQALPDELAAHLQELARTFLSSQQHPNAHQYALEQIDRALLAEALRCTHGNQTEAARLLGITRQTMYAKLRKYSLSAQAFASAAST